MAPMGAKASVWPRLLVTDNGQLTYRQTEHPLPPVHGQYYAQWYIAPPCDFFDGLRYLYGSCHCLAARLRYLRADSPLQRYLKVMKSLSVQNTSLDWVHACGLYFCPACSIPISGDIPQNWPSYLHALLAASLSQSFSDCVSLHPYTHRCQGAHRLRDKVSPHIRAHK